MNRRFTEEIHTQVVNKYIHDRMFSKSVAIRENENQNEILIHIYQNGSFSFSNILYIYSRETQREAETQAEGEAGYLQGAHCRTRSQDSKITT